MTRTARLWARPLHMLRMQFRDGDIELVESSGLFSPEHYVRQLGGRAGATSDPIRHYLIHGERAGFSPSVLFDTEWYASEYQDALEFRSLLVHFILFGDAEHRSPHPLFHPAYYVRQTSEPIDRPFAHFLDSSAGADMDPHPMFDTARFLDTRAAAVRGEGSPNPLELFLDDVTDDEFLAPVFMGRYYADQRGEPYRPDRHNVLEYVKRSRFENLSPHPGFDVDFYLQTNKDVQRTGSHAYLHFLLTGRDEGRLPHAFDTSLLNREEAPQPAILEREFLGEYTVRRVESSGKGSLPAPVMSLPLQSPPTAIAVREWNLRQDVASRLRLDRGATLAGPRVDLPTLSLVMPVYRPPLAFLDRAIRSVLQQSCGNWELCIVDDASEDSALSTLLMGYVTGDPRVKVATAQSNGGIARASNAALSLASGAYVGLIDHDDMLTVDAVEQVLERIQQRPHVDVVYSDECTIDVNDVPLTFFSKPDWSPVLLLSCMYTGHLSVYRRELVQKIGGFRPDYDYSQDYDLALRVADTHPRVEHIQAYLYGWRSTPGSASQGGKPYARSTNLAALQDALDRRGFPGRAVGLPTSNRAVREGSTRHEKVSIIIPSDDAANIRSAVRSIRDRTTYRNVEIVVVTNSEIVSSLAGSWPTDVVHWVHYDKPFNFSDKCNAGAAEASGSRLVFYNDDVQVLSRDWVEVLLDAAAIDGVGAVGPKLLYENGTIQHAGMVTGVRRLVGTAFHTAPADTDADFGIAGYAREVSVLCGACLMIDADVYRDLGGFDPDSVPIGHSDVDLCFRIRAHGLTCVYVPFATLRHVGHQSLATMGAAAREAPAQRDRSGLYLLKRWVQEVAYDPYFPAPMRDLHYIDSQEPFQIFPGEAVGRRGAGAPDVLLVSHDLSNSGAPRVLIDIARVLHVRGCYVCACAPSDGPMRQRLNDMGIDVIIDDLLLTGHKYVTDFAALFDFAIANTAVTWRFVQQVKDITPVFWYIHESGLVDHLADTVDGFLGTLRATDRIWAVSGRTADALRRHGVEEFTSLQTGVDERAAKLKSNALSRVSALARGAGRRTEPAKVVLIGSFEPRKGQDLAVLGVLALPRELQRKVRLRLFGRVLDQPFSEAVRALAAGSDSIMIGGELSPEQCLRELSDADIVLVPSRDDPLPLVSLDALARGRVLVTSRTTGTSDWIVHGRSGFVLEHNSPEEIADILGYLLEKRQQWATWGAEARQCFAENFSWEGFTDRLIQSLHPHMSPAPVPSPITPHDQKMFRRLLGSSAPRVRAGRSKVV